MRAIYYPYLHFKCIQLVYTTIQPIRKCAIIPYSLLNVCKQGGLDFLHPIDCGVLSLCFQGFLAHIWSKRNKERGGMRNVLARVFDMYGKQKKQIKGGGGERFIYFSHTMYTIIFLISMC